MRTNKGLKIRPTMGLGHQTRTQKQKKKKKRPRDGEWAWVIKQDHKGQMIGPINGRKIGQMG